MSKFFKKIFFCTKKFLRAKKNFLPRHQKFHFFTFCIFENFFEKNNFLKFLCTAPRRYFFLGGYTPRVLRGSRGLQGPTEGCLGGVPGAREAGGAAHPIWHPSKRRISGGPPKSARPGEKIHFCPAEATWRTQKILSPASTPSKIFYKILKFPK